MSKRDEAFELFSQGRKPGCPCFEPLELKPETLKRYYRDWQKIKQNKEPAPVVEATPTPPKGKAFLSSIRSDANFGYNGMVFRKDSVLNGGNIAGIEVKTERRLVFRSNTLVVPK